ncbi:MAG: hypothetical protein HFJ46_01735 [Clostridia bacterium]|jgi:asparagine synthase (glutamine-hydrolysing)|nr:hypothetical protein [Clostridia bacterium]
MCGIVGRVNYEEDISENRELIENMTNILSKRGPDEEGYYFSKHVNLGHRRLNIVDIENGKQPMSTIFNETKYTITYNGQLYNSEELREDLKTKGFKFRRLF